VKKAILLFIIVVLVEGIFTVILMPTAIFDDAYITFRYARNISRGLGPIYNIGERVEGCTTFLFMVLLAPFAALKINLKYVSVGISVVSLALIAVSGRRRISREPHSPYNSSWEWIFPFLIATSPALVHWSLSGMETVLFAAVVTGAVLLTEREMDNGLLPVASSITCLLAALIRPEGINLAAALLLSRVLFDTERNPRPVRFFCAVFGLGYGIYFAWRFSYYGYFFPNTYYAKIGGFSPILVGRGILYLLRGAIAGVFPVVAAFLFIVARRRRITLHRWEKTSLIIICGFGLQSIFSGGDFMPYFRFLIPIWPLTILLTWSMLPRVVTPYSAGAMKTRGLLGRFVLGDLRKRTIVGLIVLFNTSMLFLDMNEAKVFAGSAIVRHMEKIARTLDEILPKDSNVAAIAIGAIGYSLDRPVIDLLGLTDEHIAHVRIKTGVGVAGHEKYDAQYVLARRPDVILACVEMGESPSEDCSKSQTAHALRAFTSLLERKEFQENYVFCNHKIKKGYLSTYLRRDHLGQPGYRDWFTTGGENILN